MPSWMEDTRVIQSEDEKIEEADGCDSNIKEDNELKWTTILSSIGKAVEEWCEQDLLGYEFETVTDAEHFYIRYAHSIGFAIRRDDLRTDKISGLVLRRQWVCHREGFRSEKNLRREGRKRETRLTRCGCKAGFRVNNNIESGKYVVKEFKTVHNHDNARQSQLHLIPQYRHVSEVDKQHISSLKSVGVKGSHIMDYMVSQSGGFEFVGYTMKDMYNFIDSDRREKILDTDSEAAIAYLSSKVSSDPDMYFRYAVDDENILRYLFWADGTMRLDYASFGDVICFDATYDTNGYRLPYVVILGVNNHFKSTVFGCALLSDETEEAYVWVLQRFIESMGNKVPVAVITDSAAAIRAAIEQVLPDVHHRLCSWHMQRNCATHVKDQEFRDGFSKLMFRVYSPNEFEEEWNGLVERNGLKDLDWIKKTYERRHLWSTAYLGKFFFAGMTSNQRSEGMHSFQKRFVGSKVYLIEFVSHIDRALGRLREVELAADYATKNSSLPLTTHFKAIESHAASIYTHEMFKKVRQQISSEAKLFLLHSEELDGIKKYCFGCIGRDYRISVDFSIHDKYINCTCNVFSYHGIPCRHAFGVMKHERLSEIPQNLIKRRWTKDAKEFPFFVKQNSDIDVHGIYMRRRADIFTRARKLFNNVVKKDGVEYIQILSALDALIVETCNSDTVDPKACQSETVEEKKEIVKDPVLRKKKHGIEAGNTKSGTKKRATRRCSRCGEVGHNQRRCKVKVPATDAHEKLDDGDKVVVTGNHEKLSELIPATPLWSGSFQQLLLSQEPCNGELQPSLMPSSNNVYVTELNTPFGDTLFQR